MPNVNFVQTVYKCTYARDMIIDSIMEALQHSIIFSTSLVAILDAILIFFEMPKGDKVSSTRFLKKKVLVFQICQNILYGHQI